MTVSFVSQQTVSQLKTSTSESTLVRADGQAFSEVLRGVSHRDAAAESTPPNLLERFAAEWQQVETRRQETLQGLPASARRMFELQSAVQDLHFQTLTATKLGEAASGTLRQLQQMGSS